ncbi:hypothetical protein GCM10007857_85830 [Bradyrhizobium iriomotense]|uniref:Uncharacterized protein n=1 Tax=Bradyrhizobium iriomotense TaxID=441950 RepID=A0ABQ6BBY6_9BRAD|nr:hypothetical protein GCM10007857_85830 [Bradyrhizobium iriomotense]
MIEVYTGGDRDSALVSAFRPRVLDGGSAVRPPKGEAHLHIPRMVRRRTSVKADIQCLPVTFASLIAASTQFAPVGPGNCIR